VLKAICAILEANLEENGENGGVWLEAISVEEKSAIENSL